MTPDRLENVGLVGRLKAGLRLSPASVSLLASQGELGAMARYDCGTHTAFFGRVEDVIIPSEAEDEISPLDWLNGAQASIAIERPV